MPSNFTLDTGCGQTNVIIQSGLAGEYNSEYVVQRQTGRVVQSY